MADIVQTFRQLCTPPEDEAAFNTWLEQKDALTFLRSNVDSADLVLYAGLPSLYIHAVGVPVGRVDPPDHKDLLDWDFRAEDSWAWCQSFNPPAIAISPPLSSTRTKTLDGGTKLVFPREFEGFTGGREYFEILQEFLHLFDLHYLAERKAYCRLDRHGDLEDVIRILTVPSDRDIEGTVILCQRAVLDEWMTLTNSTIVQTFDVTRFKLDSFNGWGHPLNPRTVVDADLLYHFVLQTGNASFIRGVQIIRSTLTTEQLLARFDPARRQEDREYESFIAVDFKSDRVGEISTAPGQTANYFQQSDLPFEMSPAFFSANVLRKYKADTDKYTLTDRSISCRNAWHLQTYDVNEQGQVHTYLVYLRRLPHDEQLYWKSFNELPKGGLSRRAFRTDFEGRWYRDYDPLPSIRTRLEAWCRNQVPWWSLRNPRLLEQVHYPVTAAADEWADELMQLDKLVVEGFQEKWLRAWAAELGRNPDPKLRSLKIIEECLIGLDYEQDHARKITAALHRLHDLRSQLKGHASGERADQIKREAIADHGSYGKHFRDLCAEIDEALLTIAEAFQVRG